VGPGVCPRRTIVVTVGIGDCESFERATVAESDEAVVIGAIARVHSDGACTQQLGLHCETITLAAPLGDRLLVHATLPADRPTGTPLLPAC
jgi:hypothetical protein